MPRERLPNRRACVNLDFEHMGVRFTGTVGRYPDGRLGEIFLDTLKTNTMAGILIRDSAIDASFALQNGCPPAALRAALTRNEDERGAGSLAMFLDLVTAEAVP